MITAVQSNSDENTIQKALYCEEAEKTFQEQLKLYNDMMTYLNVKNYLEEKENEKKIRRRTDEQG